uniref:AAA+ ATPase domain-containing protein n=1 Tax=Corethron hystrix TaxID=216773 RepID=A0A7S1BV13_9STRA|mmetsp:Transcript_39793/g.93242  ORF Transcript_39793/g.93242 Transcript_39793/m.93242 type:complete len:768 (+) Transcript_39793:1018-3321(+)|eukprot:CAMPEP_0113316918 /NCGR_PEP_ID=MMETSP0010_2-20120614/12016_1 /TAXON_ID=216773 ORGANISM="Corethron hystrix, Strain 308" /NCGR_SAMPLE_ID=MMETSP0010_2 /ASSEMBLY_ACC=CAM_ASM_000155 /LENGTH=767 /DNA_ID=CAMNT_0000173759 /DNA_START=629 /DNA_END=2932 /DNA_ORIENTATION=- /assembly_acc=CAM_ASM_000155
MFQPFIGLRGYKQISKVAIGPLKFNYIQKQNNLALYNSSPYSTVRTAISPLPLTAPPNNVLNQQPIRQFTGAIANIALKHLERTADRSSSNSLIQSSFLRRLRDAGHHEAVIQRFEYLARSPAYAVDSDAAQVYVDSLLHSNRPVNPQQLGILGESLAANGSHQGGAAEALRSLSASTKGEGKLSILTSMRNFANDGIMAGGAAAAGMGAAAQPATSAGLLQTNPQRPLHVSIVSQPPHSSAKQKTSFLRSSMKFVGPVIMCGVAITAFGALMDSGLSRPFSEFNKNNNMLSERPNTRFDEVKGCNEAKAELEEIVEYLKDASKFTRLGGKLPRGIMLKGPPGTGKTLLAKAIAGEAGVPFFYASGSSFEEMYVGVGASRVRSLFQQAKKEAPCIVFIDEIDAVGGNRSLKDQSALKQTLNELLVQMDGFEDNSGIIVIGATNFAQSLDPALLRPGRFDKHVQVSLPDVQGRKEILELFGGKTVLASDVDLNTLARGTPGMSGADLYNLVNQAAIQASVAGLSSVSHQVLEWAKDKILMGAERKSAVITPDTAKCTAYHEAGHALVNIFTQGANPIHKATIMPRGSSLGMVMQLPLGDQTSQNKKQMLAWMDVCMGGRVAEELIFGEDQVTSGAYSDLDSATSTARNMVTKYGFSGKLGKVHHDGKQGEKASEETRAIIDAEVRRLLDESYARATELLKKHKKEHVMLAEALMEYETLTGDEVRDLVLRGKKPKREVFNKKGDGSMGDQTLFGQIRGKVGARREQDQ